MANDFNDQNGPKWTALNNIMVTARTNSSDQVMNLSNNDL